MKIVDIPATKKPVLTKTELDGFIELHQIFAKVQFEYFTSLISEGFTSEQALEVVKANRILNL